MASSSSQDTKIWESEHLSSLFWDTHPTCPLPAIGQLTAGDPVPEIPMGREFSTGKRSLPADSSLGKRLISVRHVLLRTSAVQVYEAKPSPGPGMTVIRSLAFTLAAHMWIWNLVSQTPSRAITSPKRPKALWVLNTCKGSALGMLLYEPLAP